VPNDNACLLVAMMIALTGFAGLLYFTRAAPPAGRDIFFFARQAAPSVGKHLVGGGRVV
jgi:hypothetical protein